MRNQNFRRRALAGFRALRCGIGRFAFLGRITPLSTGEKWRIQVLAITVALASRVRRLLLRAITRDGSSASRVWNLHELVLEVLRHSVAAPSPLFEELSGPPLIVGSYVVERAIRIQLRFPDGVRVFRDAVLWLPFGISA